MQPTFLATTALREFWDPEQPILFLGSWCLRQDRRSDWEGLTYQVMPRLWDDRNRFYQATHYLQGCYERLFEQFADYLNSVHRMSASPRYWRILIGPWLVQYLHTTYDRYVHVKEAVARHPGLTTILLDPQAFRVPKDAYEAMAWSCDDPYNLQIFSELLMGLGHTFPAQILGTGQPAPEPRTTRTGWRESISETARKGSDLSMEAVQRFAGDRWQIALCDMVSSRSTLWALAWRTGFRVLPLDIARQWSFRFPTPAFDHHRRGLASLAATDDFERLAIATLPYHAPTLYLEAFDCARAETFQRHHRLPPVLTSAIGWYFNEPLKFLAAEAAEHGSRLVTTQHGGGYGISRFVWSETHESRIADSSMVWGWAPEGGSRINLPNPALSRLVTQARPSLSRTRRTVLFVGTDHSRYLYRFNSSPMADQLEDYFAWQCRFLNAVADPIRAAIRFRPYPHDYGHAVRTRLTERFATLQWDESSAPLSRQLRQSRLTVIDHCSTTFLESLAANGPTILFWDPRQWEARETAEPDFQRLRKVGILWNSPEEAAEKVAAVYEDPAGWWERPAVQEARQHFVDRYALGRADWAACWVRVLKQEMALSRIVQPPSWQRAFRHEQPACH